MAAMFGNPSLAIYRQISQKVVPNNPFLVLVQAMCVKVQFPVPQRRGQIVILVSTVRSTEFGVALFFSVPRTRQTGAGTAIRNMCLKSLWFDKGAMTLGCIDMFLAKVQCQSHMVFESLSACTVVTCPRNLGGYSLNGNSCS